LELHQLPRLEKTDVTGEICTKGAFTNEWKPRSLLGAGVIDDVLALLLWLLRAAFTRRNTWTFGLYLAEREGKVTVQMDHGKCFPLEKESPKTGAHLRRSFSKPPWENSAYRFG